MERFDEKVVVITGAASGLGREVALAFANAGATLALADINADGLQQLKTDLGDHFVEKNCLIKAADLSSREACVQLIAEVVKVQGGVDVLVNVAGILSPSPLADVSEAQWNLVLSVNLSAPFWLSQAAMPHLLERGGNIVNIASSGATLGEAYLVPYTSSKAAVVQMTRSMAMEFIKKNVRINSISPGGMNTNMAQSFSLPDDVDMEIIGRYMGVRPPAEPNEIAEFVLFVASDRAKHIHGADLLIDGGMTAG